ncbi:hypothetical protein J8N05_15190 [Streptomyces sp. BH-SS-21]|uniref:Uncharacterized protein n=1 Tax=Streptomyces liliiviolaceus TaxID=2823109 RepID=A0A940XTB9_9ACTN|nr:hypothetical protein [Streptomyces liliiviolaceus]MBQ0849545.1 hypothetical protein [Streptomyces liliiviolaceus]
MTIKLSRAVLTLLQTIADQDDGHGILFHHAPCGRWRLDGTQYTVNDRTFHPLAALGLVDIGNGHTDPVKATAAGRAYLAGGTK